MNALEQFAQENFNEGFKKGVTEAKQRSITKLAQYLVKQSGNKLSMEEALKQAKELLS